MNFVVKSYNRIFWKSHGNYPKILLKYSGYSSAFYITN